MFPKDEHLRRLQGFEILERLGTGGAGQVFLARSQKGKLVAIKVLSDAAAHDPAFSAVLAREASLCVRLRHPSIVQVRAFVEEAGIAALVFEYVQGVALGRLLRFLASDTARLPDRAAWHVVDHVLAALAYAHSQTDAQHQPAPIVHRDVSPSNVLLAWSGEVKLTDFGMAKMIGVSPATRLGLVKGTLGCMAPEQARGDAVTERADVYAAALLAWRLATGLAPFARFRDDTELLRAMRYPRVPALGALRPDLPRPLLDGIARALVVDPEARTIRAAELREIVRSQVDADEGGGELARILTQTRESLERAVRSEASFSAPLSDKSPHHTMRYEEVALAFDEPEGDAPSDGGLASLPPFVVRVAPQSARSLPLAPRVDADDTGPPPPAAASDPAPEDPGSPVEPEEPAVEPEERAVEPRGASDGPSPGAPVVPRWVIAAAGAAIALVLMWACFAR